MARMNRLGCVELPDSIMFTVGVSAQSPNQGAARDVIKLLKGPTALPVLKTNGMERE